MSQEYQPQDGKGNASSRPQYMQVGAGSTSESANRLQSILNNDSGYGGSIADNSSNWDPSMTADMPTPVHTPIMRGEHSEEAEKERRSMMPSHLISRGRVLIASRSSNGDSSIMVQSTPRNAGSVH